MKTAIITGAAGGMGMEITKAVVNAGYHVVMTCRDITVGEMKREEILSACQGGSVEVMQLDLSDLDAVGSFTTGVIRKFDTVDLLMNNAGIIPTCFEQTGDGFERSVCINYIAPYLLTRKISRLMPKGARIVNMVSCTYAAGRIDLPEFFYKGRKDSFRRLAIYSNTKLALVFFTIELSKRLKPKGIMVNAADPGIVSTNIITMKKWFDPLTDIFFRPFIKTPVQGAASAIKLLLDDTCAEVTGRIFTAKGNRDISLKYKDSLVPERLWIETEKILDKYME